MGATYGLLQLPKMPELKNRDLSDFPEVPNLDINTIPYKDKVKEKIRLQKLEQYQKTGTMSEKWYKLIFSCSNFNIRNYVVSCITH